MGQPLVSVIIPAYNSGDRIIETIRSALSQTYPNVEVLVIDDASTDDTWQQLQHFKDKIRLIRHATNQGLSATRNEAIRAARGEFIALLDHDDLWVPEKLIKQMRLFERDPNVALAFSDCLCQMSNGKSWRYFQENPPARQGLFEHLLERNFIACPTIVIRKQILDRIGLFKDTLRYSEEHELILRIARIAPIDYCDEVLATYRIHESNFSKGKLLNNLERVSVLNVYLPEVPALQGEIAIRHLIAATLYLKQNNWKEMAGHLAVGLTRALLGPQAFYRSYRSLKKSRQNRQALLN